MGRENPEEPCGAMIPERLNQARDKVHRQLLLNFALTSSPDTLFLIRRIRYDSKDSGQVSGLSGPSHQGMVSVLVHP